MWLLLLLLLLEWRHVRGVLLLLMVAVALRRGLLLESSIVCWNEGGGGGCPKTNQHRGYVQKVLSQRSCFCPVGDNLRLNFLGTQKIREGGRDSGAWQNWTKATLKRKNELRSGWTFKGKGDANTVSLTRAVLSILLILWVKVVDGISHDVPGIHCLLQK